MLSHPRIGDRVELRYAAARVQHWPHHGKQGTVVIVGKGRPRNHCVRLDDGKLVGVPAGNLRKEPTP